MIVSSALPKEIKRGLGIKDGVWICDPFLFLPLAEMIRQKLFDVAKERYISQNRENKAELLYDYVTSHEFIQQVEAIVEVYKDMNDQILKERAALEKHWKTREAQVQKLFLSTAGIIGAMRGKIGSSMPIIKGMDLLEAPESNN